LKNFLIGGAAGKNLKKTKSWEDGIESWQTKIWISQFLEKVTAAVIFVFPSEQKELDSQFSRIIS
jgi:hypothetical protein